MSAERSDIRSSQRSITPELVATNQDVARGILFELQRANTPIAQEAWAKLCEKGICAPDRVLLHAIPGQTSMTRDGAMAISVHPWNEQEKKSYYFEDQNIEGDKEVLYEFNHEISHELFRLALFNKIRDKGVCENLYSVVEAADDARSHSNLGLTAHGNRRAYAENFEEFPEYRRAGLKTTNTQALEDTVELINMFLFSPDYLKRYLDFLSDERSERQRQQLGLHTISRDVAEAIYANIYNFVRAFLAD